MDIVYGVLVEKKIIGGIGERVLGIVYIWLKSVLWSLKTYYWRIYAKGNRQIYRIKHGSW